MLQSIRERAQGVIAWIIVGLITIPFALFGINEYLGGGSEAIVATVNGHDITEREFDIGYREFRQQLRERMGKEYRPDLLDEAALRREVLDSMIQNTLVAQRTRDFGLRIGDDLVRQTILGVPSFKVDGQFDQQAYERGVRRQGLTPAGFEEQVRQGIVSRQIGSAIRLSAFATPVEVERLVRLRLQERDLSYLVLPAGGFSGTVDVSAEEVRAHYEANPGAYMVPERIRAEYLELHAGDIVSKLDVDDATIAAYYENHRDEYMTAERRQASHILFALDSGAEAAEVEAAEAAEVEAAEAAARAALERIRAGESFAAVAGELSQDPASAEFGGDLGTFETGSFGDQAIDDALAAMTPGELSEPVRSGFGVHLFQLAAVHPPQGKSLEEAFDQVRMAYLRSEAERQFYEYADRLGNIAYDDPSTLLPAAEALGLEVRKSDWVTRDGGDGIFASPRLINTLFSDDVLNQGNNSEVIELEPEHVVVARVVEHQAAAVKPLDEVRAAIEAELQRSKASAKAGARVNELIAELRAGTGMLELAQREGLTLINQGFVDRGAPSLDPAILAQLFRMPKPGQEGQAVYASASLVGGDAALIALKGVREGTLEQAAELGGEQMLAMVLQRALGETYYQRMLENLRQQGDVSITARAPQP
ncbi:MAG: hypothetical protein B0D96_06135 [Candidatus Sedimenticola endophacoides]|uniref:Periplasmic chaperone PpiD n=1 Tax=Candidatus Sedimenticola endophacoides TaxID=2548426 RepID=A0A657PMX9_9GAMM|nr:MAG: hypothetical protein B0D94_04240 [Candidatus Sedimenticola endophacoides]OQX34380.1 MAG: hypothetical protein B0D84_03490 [Candidatus Sedimenticola endophacoides]OQX35729.1 MAG: hypothetical protein B0D96_06135 [Candidatus Sedimenticola endophacoides]OQX41000.1 MAG: hypothetical protein B0D89_05730 [Candidatus Sedimenticola endophacoides]PUD99386.1 MAG: hypothetical protein C3L26_09170 [Candidatus Sedimenticola endophacoides]